MKKRSHSKSNKFLLVSVCQTMQDVKSLKTLLLILEKFYMSLDMRRKNYRIPFVSQVVSTEIS